MDGVKFVVVGEVEERSLREQLCSMPARNVFPSSLALYIATHAMSQSGSLSPPNEANRLLGVRERHQPEWQRAAELPEKSLFDIFKETEINTSLPQAPDLHVANLAILIAAGDELGNPVVPGAAHEVGRICGINQRLYFGAISEAMRTGNRDILPGGCTMLTAQQVMSMLIFESRAQGGPVTLQ